MGWALGCRRVKEAGAAARQHGYIHLPLLFHAVGAAAGVPALTSPRDRLKLELYSKYSFLP